MTFAATIKQEDGRKPALSLLSFSCSILQRLSLNWPTMFHLEDIMQRALALTALLLLLICGVGTATQTPDITGKWTASFETQIGTQNYTYDFVVKDSVLTGHAKSNVGEGDLSEGKVSGDTVTFVEHLKFQDMDLRIEYKGKIVSADEIKFTRQVGDIASEELTAKRAK